MTSRTYVSIQQWSDVNTQLGVYSTVSCLVRHNATYPVQIRQVSTFNLHNTVQ